MLHAPRPHLSFWYGAQVPLSKLARVKNIVRTSLVTLPRFVQDQEKYRATLKQIGQLNGIISQGPTDTPLPTQPRKRLRRKTKNNANRPTRAAAMVGTSHTRATCGTKDNDDAVGVPPNRRIEHPVAAAARNYVTESSSSQTYGDVVRPRVHSAPGSGFAGAGCFDLIPNPPSDAKSSYKSFAGRQERIGITADDAGTKTVGVTKHDDCTSADNGGEPNRSIFFNSNLGNVCGPTEPMLRFDDGEGAIVEMTLRNRTTTPVLKTKVTATLSTRTSRLTLFACGQHE